VMVAMRMSQDYNGSHNIPLDEEPKIDAIRFLKILKDYNELLWDGCTTHINLSVIL